MKNLIINISLISTLLLGQSALAQEEVKPVVEPIETVVVIAKSEVASFEIYSMEIIESDIDSAMELVLDGISASIANNGVSLVKAVVNIDGSK